MLAVARACVGRHVNVAHAATYGSASRKDARKSICRTDTTRLHLVSEASARACSTAAACMGGLSIMCDDDATVRVCVCVSNACHGRVTFDKL